MTKHITSIHTLLTTALLLVSLSCCSRSDREVEPHEDGMAIAFAQLVTRVPLEEVYNDFLVKARKRMGDASQLTVMDMYTVSWKPGAWNYEQGGQYLKFWDMAATQYTFAAVAPVTQPQHVNIDDDGHISLTNVTDGTEWIVARTIRDKDGLTDRDDIVPSTLLHGTSNKIQALQEDVPLCFHRIMSQVEFRIYSENGELPLTPLSITIHDMVRGGSYSDKTGWAPNATREQLPIFYNDMTVNTYTRETAQTVAPASPVLPQPLDEVWVRVQIGNLNIDVAIPLDDSWLPCTRYIYYLKVSDSRDIILVDIDVEPWSDGGDVIIDDPLTNW